MNQTLQLALWRSRSSLLASSRAHLLPLQGAASCGGRPLSTRRSADLGTSSNSSTSTSSSAASTAAEHEAAVRQLEAAGITDAAAKVELLASAGIPPSAVPRYSSFLCSATSHIAVRLAFLEATGKLRRPPQLWAVICPADEELCVKHGLPAEELQAFRRHFLAGSAWRTFAERHGLHDTVAGSE